MIRFEVLEKFGKLDRAVYVMRDTRDPTVEYVTTCESEELSKHDLVDPNLLSLHTAVHLKSPPLPSFPYLSAALLGLWKASPRTRDTRALILGLGGGNAPRFINHTWPRCTPLSVEISEEMVQAASRWGGIGAILVGDALKVVDRIPDHLFDFILVDCYSFQRGVMPEQFWSEDYLRTLRRLLTSDGVVAFNFFDVPPPLRYKEAGFKGKLRVTSAPKTGESNQVVLLSPEPLYANDFRGLECEQSDWENILFLRLPDYSFHED